MCETVTLNWSLCRLYKYSDAGTTGFFESKWRYHFGMTEFNRPYLLPFYIKLQTLVTHQMSANSTSIIQPRFGERRPLVSTDTAAKVDVSWSPDDILNPVIWCALPTLGNFVNRERLYATWMIGRGWTTRSTLNNRKMYPRLLPVTV